LERHVQAQTEAPDAVREAMPPRLRELGMTLAACGFKVVVDADRCCLIAVNKAAAPDGRSDSLAIAYGRIKLVQSVYLAVDDTGDLCWYWQWSRPTGGGSGAYERLCPAAEATERISRVLALREEPVGVDK
jgi:hypothetical protein